jgi:NAD(P)-dependent dehydrogenase (short-subunit alcohol dehydrogenase family)
MNARSSNKKLNVVITGATSGIGAAIATSLAEDGHQIFAASRRQDRLEKLSGSSDTIDAHVCDVTSEESVKAFVAWVGTKCGHVDALITCAGAFGAIGPAATVSLTEWRQTLEVNLLGTLSVIQAVLPLLKESTDARILTFSGGGAFGTFPNYSAYAVSKAAVVRLSENLAVELARDGIGVNAIAPGFVATEIHERTLEVGPDDATQAFYEETRKKLETENCVPIETPIACVKRLLSAELHGLTGKTLSASFDPWPSAAFVDRIPEINASDLYTMRRTNLVNLDPTDELRELSKEERFTPKK